MKLVEADDKALRYEGRVDFSNPKAPTIIYAGSSIHVRFTGTSVGVRVRNIYHDLEPSIGFSIDGMEGKAVMGKHPEAQNLALKSGLRQGTHDLVLWKRAGGGNYYFDFIGLLLDDGASVSPLGERPTRRIECYGDSVSAGEVCELLAYTGKTDPDGHDGKFSNSWHSYSMMTARAFGAEIHNNAQGGIAVLDNTGYFVSGTVGLESTWDKLRYNPELGPYTPWDFSQWTPHVVIFALGQNDSHPIDFIDADAGRRETWKSAYANIIRNVRGKYPRALFVVITTLLNHSEGWDTALDEMVKGLSDPRTVRFRFTRNGAATPGHPRIGEEAEMAHELTAFLSGYGKELWEEA